MNPINLQCHVEVNVAAEKGEIDLLYAVIKNDPSILENIDSKQFIETPLHIAATKGHLRFATEIMNLKPSFASKLNQQGLSPIHLAMQNNQKKMVFCFVDKNKELVRVKGREGLTPLHFASQNGEIELLAYFLFACPDSIEDVTVAGETALHIAVKNNNYEALHLLVCFLRKNYKRGARKLEYKILNWKDEADNTILHISALSNQPQALQLLVKTNINLKAKNLENKTAFDIALTAENKSILFSVGVKPGSQVTDAPRLAHKLRSKTTIIDKVFIYISRTKRDISEEQRNIWLIVATLVATATYQSALTPLGGVYQGNASDDNLHTISSNYTISNQGNVGKSVLSGSYFLSFLFLNMVSFFASTIAIFILTPSGGVGALVFNPVGWLVICYLFSMWRISPKNANSKIVNIVLFSITFFVGIGLIITVYSRHQRIVKKWNRSS